MNPDTLLLFTPVPAQRVTANGWSPEVQRAFVAALARVGTVAAAARSVGRSSRSAYQLRVRAGADCGFARAWDSALARGRAEALDIAIGRGLEKRREPVWYRGRQVGWRIRHDNTLLLAALRALDGVSSRFTRIDPRDPDEVFRDAYAALTDEADCIPPTQQNSTNPANPAKPSPGCTPAPPP